ncbi:hypothetical protein [Lactococcus fujiensis]|uniref:Uncharacterized protein n=1 Tax=Lactococcus fujiensis JCM 16395 TaxID=1291764 RepID=A0A2A5RLI8_9LACT|nr:hypothetical protein [Lactococcus fujiensis]PCS00118.1 hypothetical protein RT41_GL001429 [Lactococcus fujiensis JCM 16395]
MQKIINVKNKKVHFLQSEHQTMCGLTDKGVEGYAKPIWQATNLDVNCKLCLKKWNQLGQVIKESPEVN